MTTSLLVPAMLAALWWGQRPILMWADQDPRIRDLEFNLAVEQSIAGEPGTAPPEPFRGLIDQLGAPCHGCRQIASGKLQRASRWDQRWLFWGLWHRDAEVRARSNAILKRLNACAACLGTGVSSYNSYSTCYNCHGWRTTWHCGDGR